MNTTSPIPPSEFAAAPSAIDALVARAQAALSAGDDATAGALLEQALAIDPRRPRPLQWLAAIRFRAGDYASAAERLTQAAALRPQNPEIRHNLAIALAQTGRQAEAIAVLRQLLAEDGEHLSARLHLALYLQQTDARIAACGEYIAAIRQTALRPALLDGASPAVLHLLAEGRALVQQSRRDVVDAALAPFRDPTEPQAIRRIEACFDAHVERRTPDYAHPQQRPGTLYIPGLQPRPFFEREDFPWIDTLEAAYPVILEELNQVLNQAEGSFQPYIQLDPGSPGAAGWGDLNRSTDWSAFHLFRHGRTVSANTARCPRTMAVLEQLPLMRIPRHAPEVLFSVLRPHRRIPPHFGSINGRLIVHMPLIVPPNCGALCAAGEARVWEPGRCLIFDDSFLHEAWNDSDQLRVVMLLDIWNPQLSAQEREAFSAALAAVDDFNVAAVGKPDFVFE